MTGAARLRMCCTVARLRYAQAMLFVLILIAGIAAAQQPEPASPPAITPGARTGDQWIDARLQEIDVYAQRYPDAFADEMARYQHAPRSLVQRLINEKSMAPGDVYVSCAIAQTIDRPCAQIADVWATHRADGWKVMAEQLEIAPSSDPSDRKAPRSDDAKSKQSQADVLARIKRGLVPTFDRWNRPITLDADLKRDFSGRNSRPYHWIPPESEALDSNQRQQSARRP